MSTSPDFDLEKLFLPSWAQESPSTNRYENHRGDDRPDRDSKFGDRRGGHRPPPRRDGGGPGGPGRDQNRGPRPDGARPGGPRRDGPRPAGGPGGPGGLRGPRRDDRGGDRRDDRREAPLPLPELNVTLMPDDKGVESLPTETVAVDVWLKLEI